MNKRVATALDLIVVALIAAAALPVARDELHWVWARSSNTPTSYQTYVDAWPAGRHIGPAIDLQDDRRWEAVRLTTDPADMEAYVASARRDNNARAAQDRLDELRYLAAGPRNTVLAYQRYLDTHPNGRFVQAAKQRIDALRADDAAYLKAVEAATPEAFVGFMTEFPGHRRQAVAEAAARDLHGRDLLELLASKHVEVRAGEFAGAGPIVVAMRRLTEHPLLVKIAPGTLFVARNPAYRSLVATSETAVTLRSRDWASRSVAVSSVHRLRGFGSAPDSYMLRGADRKTPVGRIAALLADAPASPEVAQAALWIAAEDADFAALGSLKAAGRGRAIQEAETATAMRIVERAGIDLRNRAIWRERKKIADALPQGELRAWLATRP